MKLRKTIGGILFGLGCALTFIGLIALILPSIENDQLKLVLASFDTPSDNALVSLMNSGMSFTLENGWKVLIAGAILLAIGLVLFALFVREPQEEPFTAPYRRPVQQPRSPIWESPASVQDQPNPFADFALWDQQFAPQKTQQSESPFASFGGPMLEPNRIEDVPAYRFAPDAYSRPIVEESSHMDDLPQTPVFSPVAGCEAAPVLTDAEPVVSMADTPVPETAPPAFKSVMHTRIPAPTTYVEPAAAITPPPVLQPLAEKKPEPEYTPNEGPDDPAPISSRIRSTMGKHRSR